MICGFYENRFYVFLLSQLNRVSPLFFKGEYRRLPAGRGSSRSNFLNLTALGLSLTSVSRRGFFVFQGTIKPVEYSSIIRIF